MLDQETQDLILDRLKSTDKEKLIEACMEVEKNIAGMNPSEHRLMTDALVSLFYLDTNAHPELAEVIDIAEDTIVKMGPETVSVLIESLTDTDLQADFHIAHTLGKIGKPAVAFLKERFRKETDPFGRGLVLLAMSKIDDPGLIEIMPEVISTMDHEHPQLRDMAVQAIGTMIECIGGVCLTSESAASVFDKLMLKLSDPHPGARSKAVHAIGKLYLKGYLGDEQKDRALTAITAILGTDGKHDWDRAFMVRKEAGEVYNILSGRTSG